MENKIFVFWTGSNEMSENRKRCLQDIINNTQCKVEFVTIHNLQDYIKEPMHEAYAYLSEVHKADYLRTYFMHFYGGGYTDVKMQRGSWVSSFEKLNANEHALICGYREGSAMDIAGVDSVKQHWYKLIGNCAYICKPNTWFTKLWYESMIRLLDSKLEELKRHPAKHPRDHKEQVGGYPMGWTEMLGRIFHKICSENLDKNFIMYDLPAPYFFNYQ
jgi:hypothetical protein